MGREERRGGEAGRANPNPPHSPFSLSFFLSTRTVIKEFGKSIGADSKQVQGLIRLAKKNGEKLGFLA